MNAFLKIDRCNACQREFTWEWVPPLDVAGHALPGTGVWRSLLTRGRCSSCVENEAMVLERRRQLQLRREQFIRIVGRRPYDEFTLPRYQVAEGNRAAFERARQFDPATEGLYFYGPCGVGKTHLAIASARRSFAAGATLVVVTPTQLGRKLRMRSPEDEQRGVDELVRATVLVLDDIDGATETAFIRVVVQEILDGRWSANRGGLVVTSQYPLPVLARRMGNRTVASRLAGLCQELEVRGPDRRAQTGKRDATC